MRIAALLIALFTMVISIGGVVTPESLMMVRRSYYTPLGIYLGGAVRIAMGLVLIVAASDSRWPRTLRVMGAMMCMQGLAANILGLERARAILEWENRHTALLRAGALVALATSGFIAFAVTKVQSEAKGNAAHK